MTKNMREVPKKALSFVTEKDTKCEFLVSEENDVTRFKMVGYSGEVISNHWFWGNLIFDLSGFKFEKDKFPILWSHDRYSLDNILGFSTKPQITDEGLVFTEDEVTFMENELVEKFKKYSKSGMPFQASISGNPTKIEYIEEGVTATVNGKEFVGPGHIWRETEFKECSVVVFGADDKTSSQVFEAGDEIVKLDASIFTKQETTTKEMEKTMDYLTFKKEHPEEASKFEARVLDEAKTKFDAEKRELISEHEAKVSDLTSKVEELEENVKKFEKEKMIFEETQRKEFAEKVWAEKLKEAEVPERLHEKVRAFVSVEKFVGEEGLDKEAFEAAVDKEVEFWAESKDENKIQGGGAAPKKTNTENEFTEEKAGDLADEMLAMIGVGSKE